VQAKWDRSDLEADSRIPTQAEITNTQPGWRYDVVVLKPNDPTARTFREASEPTDEQLNTMLGRAEESARMGVKEAAFLLLWGSLEAAMRRRAHVSGNGERREFQPRALLSQLYATGVLAREEFDGLAEAWKVRNELVHGFVAPAIDESLLQLLMDVTRRLLEESRTAQTTTN
jgi:hypothetical protein